MSSTRNDYDTVSVKPWKYSAVDLALKSASDRRKGDATAMTIEMNKEYDRLDNVSVKELKRIAKCEGLVQEGPKRTLVSRIVNWRYVYQPTINHLSQPTPPTLVYSFIDLSIKSLQSKVFADANSEGVEVWSDGAWQTEKTERLEPEEVDPAPVE